MDFQQFKAKHRNTIICPLPYEVPVFDYSRLVEWADQHRDSEFVSYQKKGNPRSIEELRAAALSAKLSFFESYFLLTKGSSDKSEWQFEFDKEFPELADFVERLPVTGEKHFGFVRQRPMHEIERVNPYGVSHIHTDEHGGFGLRFYINSRKNDLYFYGLKDGEIPDFISREKAAKQTTSNLSIFHQLKDEEPIIVDGNPLPSDAFFQKAVKSKLTQPNCSFMLNGIRAAHFVRLESTDKLTFLVMGRTSIEKRYDWARLDADIEKSRIARPQEFLYYEDLCD